MQITIAERLRPFSHHHGSFCILPGSTYQLQIFPCLVRIFDLSHAEPQHLIDLHLKLTGPFKDFTIQQDLEKGRLLVWGNTPQGFMRYVLTSGGSGIRLHLEKAPQGGMSIFQNQSGLKTLQEKEELTILAQDNFQSFIVPAIERLSLGSHKAQDWELVKRRLDFKEIFPIWYRLGRLVPCPPPSKHAGTALLLDHCQHIISQGKPEHIIQAFSNLFQAGFEGLLSPRLQDSQYQGLIEPTEVPFSLSPLVLLKEGASLIRSLFFQQKEDQLFILPALPPEFAQGRFLKVAFDGGWIDMEWTKKAIRRLILYANQDRQLTIHFKRAISCRLMGSYQKKLSLPITLSIEKNCHYFFDNFL